MSLAFYITLEQHKEAIEKVFTAISSIHQEITEFRHWCDDLLREQKELAAKEIQTLRTRLTEIEQIINQKKT